MLEDDIKVYKASNCKNRGKEETESVKKKAKVGVLISIFGHMPLACYPMDWCNYLLSLYAANLYHNTCLIWFIFLKKKWKKK